MRAPLWLLAVTASVGLVPPAVAGPGTPAEGEPAPAVSPLLADAPVATIFQPAGADDAPWRASFLAGLPFGIRVERHVVGPLWLEAGASLYLIVPAAYVAARFDLRITAIGDDSFHVRPGIGFGIASARDFDHWGDDRRFGWGIGDVDFVWRRRWRKGLYGEFGFKLGVLVPTIVRDAIPMPRAALLFGVQF